MSGYQNRMLTTNPRQFHIEAVAGNGNALDVHLVISRRLCELALALLYIGLAKGVYLAAVACEIKTNSYHLKQRSAWEPLQMRPVALRTDLSGF
jgi:hypothetical protein